MTKNTLSFTPPRNNFNIPVVHNTRELYKSIYLIGNKLTKRDKLGLHKNIEQETSIVLTLILQASFENKDTKIETLEKTRVSTEVLKQLVRTEYELKIIDEKTYISTEQKLQEISKEINGWLKYLKTQNPTP